MSNNYDPINTVVGYGLTKHLATVELYREDIEHLISRLRMVVERLRSPESEQRHMASANLLAEISALKGILEDE